MESRAQRARRIRAQRQRAGAVAALAVLLIAGIAFATCTGGAPAPSSSGTHAAGDARRTAGGTASIEAGIEPWQLGAAQSRQS
ncbi:MAG: hypothetical protein ACRD1G_19595, partial [Acidimicrobiales bacterium]